MRLEKRIREPHNFPKDLDEMPNNILSHRWARDLIGVRKTQTEMQKTVGHLTRVYNIVGCSLLIIICTSKKITQTQLILKLKPVGKKLFICLLVGQPSRCLTIFVCRKTNPAGLKIRRKCIFKCFIWLYIHFFE